MTHTASAASAASSATARLVGIFFILLLALGPFCLLYVPSVTYAPGDAVRTAALLGQHLAVFRFGLLAELAISLVEVGMMVALWRLFRGVRDGLLIASLIGRGMMVAVMGVSLVAGLAALMTAQRGGSAEVLMTLMESRDAVQQVWEGFFGLHLLLLVPVILRSGLVPRPLGALLTMAGLGYFLNSVGPLVVPALAPFTEQGAAFGAFLGEVPLFLWLLVRGVRPAQALTPATAVA